MHQSQHGSSHKGLKVVVLLCTLMTVTILPALAAKGGGGKGGGGTTSGGGTINLVIVSSSSTDGSPHHGDTVTFKVGTTATDQPRVDLKCYQSNTLVYFASTGFYASYPWPWTQNMNLASQSWASGSADCKASLYYVNGSKASTLATLSFHVSA